MTLAADTPLGLELLRSVGPLIAAGVALFIAFRAERRERRQRPELRLLYEHDTGDDFALGIGVHGTESHWVRLRVANRWGKRTADDVEVLVVDVRPQSDRGSLNGFALIWSNVFDAQGQPRTRQTIPAGVARHVDLVCTRQSSSDDWDRAEPAEGESHSSLELQVHPVPVGRRFLSAGHWTVLVALTAKDTDAVYYGIDIDFDGRWWSAERVKEHLKVSLGVAHYFGLEPDEAWARMLSRREKLGMRLETLRWLDPRNWKAMKTVRRARRLYPGRAVQIDEDGRITPLDDLLSSPGGDEPPGMSGRTSA
jgi:hypothetical protein